MGGLTKRPPVEYSDKKRMARRRPASFLDESRDHARAAQPGEKAAQSKSGIEAAGQPNGKATGSFFPGAAEPKNRTA